MVAGVAVQLTLSTLFGLTGTYFAARVFAGFNRTDRGINLIHVVMSVVMLLMPWPVGMDIPVALQLVAFTLAASWFIYLALFRPAADIGPVDGHHQKPALLWYHAIMMGSMVWMAGVMWLAPVAAGGSGSGTSGTTGMSMPGMSMSATSATAGTATASATPAWAAALCVAFAVFFVAAAVTFAIWIVRARKDPHDRRTSILIMDDAARIAMAVGMATTFIALQ